MIILVIIGVLIVGGVYYFLFFMAQTSTERSASPITPGVTKDTIRIGSVKALSGPTAFLGKEYAIGEQTYIKALNDTGGINGRTIELITYDDQYDPPKTAYYTQQLIIKDNVFALLNYVGTPTGKQIVPMINEVKIPLVGLFSGAQLFRNPLQPYIFNIRTSYHEEAEKIVDYLVNTRGITRISVLYQYDDFGFDVLQGIKNSLKKHSIEPTATASYERNTLNIEQALNIIEASKPEAVILASVYAPSTKFILLSNLKGFAPVFTTMSFVGPEAFAQELGSQGEHVIVSQTIPLPDRQPNPMCLNSYEQLLGKYFPGTKPSVGTLEGFINTKLLVEGIRRAGPDLTRESLMGALQSITNYPLGRSLTASLTPTDHQALHTVYITQIVNGIFEPIEADARSYDCIQL